MGFFDGLSRGYAQGVKMKMEKEKEEALARYRDQEFQYKIDRDKVTDEQYDSNAAYLKERDAVLDAQKEKDFELRRAAENRLLKQTESDITATKAQTQLGIDRLDFDKGMSKDDIKYKRDSLTQNNTQFNAEQDRLKKNEQTRIGEAATAANLNEQESIRAMNRFYLKYGLDKKIALNDQEMKQAMFDFQKTRADVDDSQWEKTFNYTKVEARKAQARWMAKNNFEKWSFETNQERLNAEFESEMDWRREQFETATKDARLKLSLEYGVGGQLSKAYGSGSRGTGVATANEMRVSTEDLKDMFNVNKDVMDKEDIAFFEKVLTDPGASHKIMEFYNEQLNAKNIIPFEDLPNIVTIAATIPASGDSEAYRNAISGEVDISDFNKFSKSMKALGTYIPERLQLDINPQAYLGPKDIKMLEDERDLFMETVIGRAAEFVDNTKGLDIPKSDPKGIKRSALSAAFALLKSGDSNMRAKAARDIMKTMDIGAIVEEVMKNDRGGVLKNLDQNPFIKEFIIDQTGTPPVDDDDVVIDDAALMKSMESGSINSSVEETTKLDSDVPVFKNVAEAEEARRKGFKGYAIITSVDRKKSSYIPPLNQREVVEAGGNLTEVIKADEEKDPTPSGNTGDSIVQSFRQFVLQGKDADLKTEEELDAWLEKNVDYGDARKNDIRRGLIKTSIARSLKIKVSKR